LLLFLAEKFDEKSIRQIHFKGKRPSTTFDQKFDKPLGNHIYHKFWVSHLTNLLLPKKSLPNSFFYFCFRLKNLMKRAFGKVTSMEKCTNYFWSNTFGKINNMTNLLAIKFIIDSEFAGLVKTSKFSLNKLTVAKSEFVKLFLLLLF
jgi:hypothetical protein